MSASEAAALLSVAAPHTRIECQGNEGVVANQRRELDDSNDFQQHFAALVQGGINLAVLEQLPGVTTIRRLLFAQTDGRLSQAYRLDESSLRRGSSEVWKRRNSPSFWAGSAIFGCNSIGEKGPSSHVPRLATISS
jgi:hypothetical protein